MKLEAPILFARFFERPCQICKCKIFGHLSACFCHLVHKGLVLYKLDLHI